MDVHAFPICVHVATLPRKAPQPRPPLPQLNDKIKKASGTDFKKVNFKSNFSSMAGSNSISFMKIYSSCNQLNQFSDNLPLSEIKSTLKSESDPESIISGFTPKIGATLLIISAVKGTAVLPAILLLVFL